ncbi:MAG: Eco57I restriction-modification methylase domain-containing protein [Alphaproteobacteria bacterium]|nr:Eco57I restriction-modification methylase domain-containing protein [Alphaproteobacteria bacterium]
MLAGSLFTRDYLLEGIARTDQWKALKDKDFQDANARLHQLFATFAKNARPNEAETEKDLIYPVLEVLGWSDISVQPNLSTKGRKQVPDALLLADADAKAQAVAEKESWKSFRHGLAIVEAKRWETSLDRSPRGDQSVPATQMLQYLSRVDIQTSGKVRLGILTNGQVWRLYFQGALSVAEDFFEIDLAKALQLPGHGLDLFDTTDERITPEHCLRLFLVMFGREAFLAFDGQRTFHDASRETGKVWEERVTRDLSKLVFGELFPQLVTAIADHDKQRPAEIDRRYLDAVRQSALILLYRLLFVVYAEDRDLLPDNVEPYKDYSLTAMRLEIAARKAEGKAFSASSAFYWTKLKTIFKAIAEGDNTFGIPPYNGGLFAPENAALLDDIDLPDAVVTDVIYGLSHRVEDGAPRYINYRDLTVQQLGTVYERTLEYDLKVDEDGKVVVDADDTARHESGSYYTPDNLVMLIIEKAVGPLVDNLVEAFAAKAEELSHDHRSRQDRIGELRRIDPAREILRLKVCDPAMGSGHFLVSLVDWMADKVIKAMGEAEQIVTWSDEPYISPVAGEIHKIRYEISDQAKDNNWPYVDEHLEDRHIIRRMVLKRCVYGVDKNPLAVELAKVALWLHTFTVGAPLSFLDHHLRCGDSLFGSWVRPAMDRLSEWGSPLLMDAPRKRALGAAAGMQTIERLTDVDIAEVYQSKHLFDGVESMTSELSGLLTLIQAIEWHAPTSKLDKAVAQALTKGSFGDPVKLASGEIELEIPEPRSETEMEKKKREITNGQKYDPHELAVRLNEWLPALRANFFDARFLHWQVGFPGMWSQWESVELHGGFDAVIGNPPYVRQELIKEIKPALKRAYPDTYSGTADLYVYFYDQGLRLLRPGGRMSYVVTNKWMRAGYAEGLRAMFAEKAWIEFVADFGHAKKFFPDADVFPSVIVVRKPEPGEAPDETQVCAVSRDDVPEKDLEEFVEKNTYPLPRLHFTKQIWSLEGPEAHALLQKIRNVGVRLEDTTNTRPLRGLLTGLNDAYIIDAPMRDRLISSDPKLAQFIKPYLRGQDVLRWSCPDTGLFMIVMKSSENHEWAWSNAPDEAEAESLFKSHYLSLYDHFKGFEEFRDNATGKLRGLRHREDQGRYWWELRSCAYYDAFEAPKTLYVDITWTPSMLVDTRGRFTTNTCYFLPTASPSVVASMNSPIGWWYTWRTAQHGKDEALRYFTSFMADYPIAQMDAGKEASAGGLIEQIALLSETNQLADASILNWLALEFELDKPKRALIVPSKLSAEEFLKAVRLSLPKKRKLTAAEIGELRREHADTIEPARQARAEVFTLENQLSNLVNEAYGLTPEDVALMWRTAPPRMPFTPAGLASEADAPDQDEGDGENE